MTAFIHTFDSAQARDGAALEAIINAHQEKLEQQCHYRLAIAEVRLDGAMTTVRWAPVDPTRPTTGLLD